MSDGSKNEGYMDLGEEVMDGEHAAQFRLLDSFEKSVREGKGWNDLAIVFDRLVEFSRLHFMSEEVLMQRHAYPAFGVHAKEHDSLLERINKVRDDFIADNPRMTEDDLAALRQWLVEHIQTQDRAFALFLKTRTTAEW